MTSRLIFILALAASAAARPSNKTLEGGKLNGKVDLKSPLVLDDMRFVEGQLEQVKSGAGIPNEELRYPGGVVPYVIDRSTLAQSSIILAAMDNFHKNTCVRFVPRTNQANYVKIFAGEGCYSNVGMVGGQQPVSLGNGCMYKGTIVHELGHAIGFFHEQNRSDRDNHLIIYWENIQQGMDSQFFLLKPNENLLLTEFDNNGIILYGNTAFSKDGRSPTMVAKNGQRLLDPYEKIGLTPSDMIAVNKLYKCSK